MYDRVSLAGSSGLPWMVLVFHVAMGVTGLVSGTIAIAAPKGGKWHRGAGRLFVYTMIAMGLSAVAISLYEGKADVGGGALAAYLIFTGFTTLRPVRGLGRIGDIVLMGLALLFAYGSYDKALQALALPRKALNGVPAGMFIFLGTVVLLAAIGDARMIWGGGVQGSKRLARHLWRMCFGLFIANGSFIAQLTRMTWMPAWTRSVPVILVLSAGPLLVLLYWMWRVRLRQNLRGLRTNKPAEVVSAI